METLILHFFFPFRSFRCGLVYPKWLMSFCIVKHVLEVLILLHQPPKTLNYRPTPPHVGCFIYFQGLLVFFLNHVLLYGIKQFVFHLLTERHLSYTLVWTVMNKTAIDICLQNMKISVRLTWVTKEGQNCWVV